MQRPSSDFHSEIASPMPVTTIAERATVAAWVRMAGGDLAAVRGAVEDGLRDAIGATGRTPSVLDVAPWIEASLLGQTTAAPVEGTTQWKRAPASARRWVVEAQPGALMVYHCGHLARDRATNPVLHALAEYVGALDHLGAVRAYSARTALPACVVYCARRREGFARHPLVVGVLQPIEYWALVAMRERPPRVAAGKHLERQVPCSAETAARLIAALEGKMMLERRPASKGPALLDVTPLGEAAISRAG